MDASPSRNIVPSQNPIDTSSLLPKSLSVESGFLSPAIERFAQTERKAPDFSSRKALVDSVTRGLTHQRSPSRATPQTTPKKVTERARRGAVLLVRLPAAPAHSCGEVPARGDQLWIGRVRDGCEAVVVVLAVAAARGGVAELRTQSSKAGFVD